MTEIIDLTQKFIEDSSSYPFPVYEMEAQYFPTFWDIQIGQRHPRKIPKIDVCRVYFNFDGSYRLRHYGVCHINGDKYHDSDIFEYHVTTLEACQNKWFEIFQEIFKDKNIGDPVAYSPRFMPTKV